MGKGKEGRGGEGRQGWEGKFRGPGGREGKGVGKRERENLGGPGPQIFFSRTAPADGKMHFSFSAVNENADENEIPFMAENETKTKIENHFRTKTKTKVTR